MPFKIITDRDDKINFICWFNEDIIYDYYATCSYCGEDIKFGGSGIIFELVDIRRMDNAKKQSFFHHCHLGCFELNLKILVLELINKGLNEENIRKEDYLKIKDKINDD
ncbi:MAG: hypothetical protein WC144_06765 [Sulfurimonas sp.]|jgi:hypothetical protein